MSQVSHFESEKIVGTYTIGRIYRKHFKTLLDIMEVKGAGRYNESKYFFESVYVVNASRRIHRVLLDAIDEWNKE